MAEQVIRIPEIPVPTIPTASEFLKSLTPTVTVERVEVSAEEVTKQLAPIVIIIGVLFAVVMIAK